MSDAVCTLFEKDYHHGLAALVNSLVLRGFAGTVYAGHRGELPSWAQEAAALPEAAWPRARKLAVNDTCRIVFLPLETEAHLTNVKPDFMLQLFATDSFDIDQLFYVDPDIVLVMPWGYLKEWISCGIALCEDVNSPIQENHPRRVGWRRHFATHGLELTFCTAAYVNGGCVGVRRADIRFLENWQRLTELMARVIGGLNVAKIDGGAPSRSNGFAGCFDSSDQDALNATLEATAGIPYSILPRAAMAFEAGATVLPHALGPRKPWRRKYLWESLRALAPTTADKAFWRHVDGPLQSMSRQRVRSRRVMLAIASAVGRVYRMR